MNTLPINPVKSKYKIREWKAYHSNNDHMNRILQPRYGIKFCYNEKCNIA
jgi:hypothetical protein